MQIHRPTRLPLFILLPPHKRCAGTRLVCCNMQLNGAFSMVVPHKLFQATRWRWTWLQQLLVQGESTQSHNWPQSTSRRSRSSSPPRLGGKTQKRFPFIWACLSNRGRETNHKSNRKVRSNEVAVKMFYISPRFTLETRKQTEVPGGKFLTDFLLYYVAGQFQPPDNYNISASFQFKWCRRQFWTTQHLYALFSDPTLYLSCAQNVFLVFTLTSDT